MDNSKKKYRLVQTKLKLGQPADKYEQEADRIADQVMQMTEPKTQQQIEEQEKMQIQSSVQLLQEEKELQMQPEEDEEAKMQPEEEDEI
ncbi:MAG: hypothetical protein P8X90_21840 [Desulfobacterales bacterium]